MEAPPTLASLYSGSSSSALAVTPAGSDRSTKPSGNDSSTESFQNFSFYEVHITKRVAPHVTHQSSKLGTFTHV